MNTFPNLFCLSVDEEWANPEVLSDLLRMLDERRLRATFFCTKPGVEVPGHERALHPNFRRTGDTVRNFRNATDAPPEAWTDGAGLCARGRDHSQVLPRGNRYSWT